MFSPSFHDTFDRIPLAENVSGARSPLYYTLPVASIFSFPEFNHFFTGSYFFPAALLVSSPQQSCGVVNSNFL